MKIALIEDTENHAEEAAAVLKAAGHEIKHFTCMSDFIYNFEKYPYEAVITDMFFSYSDDFSSIEPCGVGIAAYCDKNNIPFVICTDGYHHSQKLQWAFGLCGKMGWTMIDGNVPYEEQDTGHSAHKEWAKALESLEKKMER